MKLICSLPNHVRSYEIAIEKGIVQQLSAYLPTIALRHVIITDDRVASFYGQELHKKLSSAGLNVDHLTFPSGEQHKTRQTKEKLEDALFEKGYGRDTAVVALGGGVVTDLVGYLAATYCRGIPLVMVPTTLLGMVDASIGGKTGVNVPYGKNLVGAIYQPQKVFIDPIFLKSLPKHELTQGVVEMIKHGLIASCSFFEYLESHVEEILAYDLTTLQKAIEESCLIKKKIVEQDERESNQRRLLNCGHTVGHALETATGYALSHGEAVAIGLLVEGYMAVQLKLLSQNSFDRIKRLLIRYQLPLCLPSTLSIRSVCEAMALDKKSAQGKPRFVMIKEIGIPCSFESAYCTTVDDHLLNQAFEWFCHDMHLC